MVIQLEILIFHWKYITQVISQNTLKTNIFDDIFHIIIYPEHMHI